MKLVDVTARELLDFCEGIGVKANMHPCLRCVILENVPEVLAGLILDSCEYWKYGSTTVGAFFNGWMCVMPQEGWM